MKESHRMQKTATFKNEVQPGLWFVKAGKHEPEYWIETPTSFAPSNTFAVLIERTARAIWLFEYPE